MVNPIKFSLDSRLLWLEQLDKLAWYHCLWRSKASICLNLEYMGSNFFSSSTEVWFLHEVYKCTSDLRQESKSQVVLGNMLDSAQTDEFPIPIL